MVIKIKRWVQPELDKALRTVAIMRKQLDKASVENLELKNRNEKLSRKVEHLEITVNDLQRALAREEQRTQTQLELIERMEQKQGEMMKTIARFDAMVDGLKGRLIKLEAERGRWIDFGKDGPKTN